MTIQTAVLVETLLELGAQVRWCSCNIFSTQDHAAAALVKAGKSTIFAWKGESLEEYWEMTLNTVRWPGGKGPTTIVDDGGDATILLLKGRESEILFEKDGVLPEPERAGNHEEKILLTIIRR